MGSLKTSLEYVGIKTATLESLVVGVNAMQISKSDKHNILFRYAQEEGVKIPDSLLSNLRDTR